MLLTLEFTAVATLILIRESVAPPNPIPIWNPEHPDALPSPRHRPDAAAPDVGITAANGPSQPGLVSTGATALQASLTKAMLSQNVVAANTALDLAVQRSGSGVDSAAVAGSLLYRAIDAAHGPQFEGRMGRHAGLGPGDVEGYSSLSEQTSIRSFFWMNDINTICETGFNAGHSAANYLLANKYGYTVRYVGFDLGRTQYSKRAQGFIETLFPVTPSPLAATICGALLLPLIDFKNTQGKVEIHWGDSKTTLPQYIDDTPDLTCDGIMVDGGHNYETSRSDLAQFLRRARCGSHVAIDDIEMGELQRAWEEAKSAGWIRQERCAYSQDPVCSPIPCIILELFL